MFQLQTFRLFTLITVISHSTAVSITYAKNNHIKTMLCPIHYSNPYTRNDIPTYLKTTLSQAPQKQKKAGSNYQEAKPHSNKIFVNTRGQRTEPKGRRSGNGTFKVAADCNKSQHPQTQTKENFINTSWFSITPSTTGRPLTDSLPRVPLLAPDSCCGRRATQTSSRWDDKGPLPCLPVALTRE